MKAGHRPDLRRAHRLRHAVEDRDPITAATRRKRFGKSVEAGADVLPVIHHPDITPHKSRRSVRPSCNGGTGDLLD